MRKLWRKEMSERRVCEKGDGNRESNRKERLKNTEQKRRKKLGSKNIQGHLK